MIDQMVRALCGMNTRRRRVLRFIWDYAFSITFGVAIGLLVVAQIQP